MLPQLDYTTYPSQLFWLLVSFSLLYFIVSSFVVPRVSEIIRKREELLSSNNEKLINYNEAVKSEQEKYELAVQKANSLAQDIARDGHLMIAEYKQNLYDKLLEDIKQLYKEGEDNIVALRQQMKNQIIDESAELVVMYYQQLIQEKLSKEEVLDKFKEEFEEKLI